MTAPLEPYITVQTPWGVFNTKNRVTDLGQVLRTTNDLGSSSSVSLTLSDTDGILLGVYGSSQMYNAPVIVWQHFEGGTGHILFTGVAGGDIVWDEGSRTLSLDIETQVTTSKVGHVPMTKTSATGVWSPASWPASWDLEIELEALNQQAFGKMWPLGFGTVINCPALRLTKPIIGKLQDSIDNDSTSMTIDGGDKFPQGVSTTIRVGKVFYTGTFTGDVFTPTTSNVTWLLTPPFYTSAFSARPEGDKDPRAAWVDDMFDYNNAWIQVTGVGIDGTALIHVSEQLGRKLILDWTPPVLLTDDHVITGFTGALKSGQIDGDLVVVEEEGYSLKYIADNWDITKGAIVTDLNAQWYVVNELPNSTILSVRAYRDLNGVRTLDIVPEAYYTVFPAQSIDGITSTLIGMPLSLERVPDEGWERDIYVSYTSAKGPNVANVIKYILDEYTDLTTDGSFASVASQVDDYPVGFALFNQSDALALVTDIAYQARCAVYKNASTVSIKYLSIVPSGFITLDDTHMLERTLKLGFTRIEDVRTHLIGSWNADYSEEGSRTLEYLNNDDLYGVVDESINLFIYNQAALAKKSLDYWGYRHSNVWRTVQFDMPLTVDVLNLSDDYSFDIPYRGETKGNVKSLSSKTHTVTVSGILASVMGGSTTSNNNYYRGDPSNELLISDPTLAVDRAVGLYQLDYYPAVSKREKPKIHTISTTNESGREVKKYDLMIQNKDTTLVDVTIDGGQTIGLIDVDNMHRTANEMYIVSNVTVDSDPLDCVSANKHISRVRWNAADDQPKVNEIWGPLMWVVNDVAKQPPSYEPGTISSKGNAFVVVGGIDAVSKTCLVAPNIDKPYSEAVFRQEDGKIPALNTDWPVHMNVGCDKLIVGLWASKVSGLPGDYTYKLKINGIEYNDDITAAPFNIASNYYTAGLGYPLLRGQTMTLRSVTTATASVKGLIVRVLMVDYGKNSRNLPEMYQTVLP